jgi:ketosteroid isomerase-like protein
MIQTLPEAAAAFFQAKNSHDVDTMLACFTAGAVVRDEGENMEMRGAESIRKWLEGTIAAYKLTVEVTGVMEQGGETVVTALVSGDFPGSPIEFYYHLRLDGDKIAQMTIN